MATRTKAKPAARKPRAKAAAAKKPTASSNGSAFAARPAILARYAEDGDKVLKLTGGDADKIEAAAKKLGWSFGKARRMFTYAQRKPGEKLFNQALSGEEVGATLIRLRDAEGRIWDPDIWSRMLTTQDVAIKAYESAGGKDWHGRGGKTAPGEAKTAVTRKRVGAKKTTVTRKRVAAKKGGTARAKRAKKA